MSSLLDFFRKQLLGQAGMDRPGQGFGGGTQGLFGQGGQMGGGLLQDNFSKMNMAEGGLLSNIPDAALLGFSLYGQGMKGKDPFEGAFPAIAQSTQLKKLMTPSKTELQKNLEAAGYKAGSEEYKAALNAYLNRNKKGNTLSKEALALYKAGQAAPDFKEWFDGLPKASQDLYKKQISPNLSAIEASFEFIKDQEAQLLERAIPLPIKDGKVDTSSLQKGISYNYNNQLVVFDGKELVPYADYIKR
tara:strand:+ start:1930 stop:2667 length:738 start_codon:yes stop_codon:yes gene_type:complete